MSSLIWFNIFITTPLSAFCFNVLVKPLFELPWDEADTPSIWQYVPKLIVFAILYDFMFGVMHFLAHTKLGFKYIHYIHHRCVHPSPLDAFYTHPVEHWFVNLWPLFASAWVVSTHAADLVVIALVSVMTTMHAHDSIEGHQHTFHHNKGHSNYGSWPYLFDYLFGTLKTNQQRGCAAQE